MPEVQKLPVENQTRPQGSSPAINSLITIYFAFIPAVYFYINIKILGSLIG